MKSFNKKHLNESITDPDARLKQIKPELKAVVDYIEDQDGFTVNKGYTVDTAVDTVVRSHIAYNYKGHIISIEVSVSADDDDPKFTMSVKKGNKYLHEPKYNMITNRDQIFEYIDELIAMDLGESIKSLPQRIPLLEFYDIDMDSLAKEIQKFVKSKQAESDIKQLLTFLSHDLEIPVDSKEMMVVRNYMESSANDLRNIQDIQDFANELVSKFYRYKLNESKYKRRKSNI